jgi:putative membrane protein
VMWHSGAGMAWWMLFGSIWFVVFWGLIIWAVVSVTNRGSNSRSTGAEPAIEIARRRYAAGEITKDQFDQIRRDLAQ